MHTSRLSRRAVLVSRCLLAITLLALTTPVMAQGQSPFVGNWYCRFANESLTGLATDTWMYEFYLLLDQQGNFQAQGQYWANSAGYYDPFYAAGQWQSQGAVMIAQGQASHQSGIQMPWTVSGSLTEGVITYRNEDQYNRMVVYCEPQRQ